MTDVRSAVLSIKGDKPAAGSVGLVLQGVEMHGRLDGLLLRMTLKQRYRNTSGRLIETVYTFPLAHGASLLGLSVALGDKRLSGAVIEKQQAAQRYEKAIDEGDTPVLVDQSAPGLYTANLGNLENGETAEIELEYAQLLRFEQGGLRLSIPTVVAPRYGDPQVQGGLALHETTKADWQASYPFTLTLHLAGPVVQARLSSPSHSIVVQPQGEELCVKLEEGAWLDRDFVLSLGGLEGQAFCIMALDGDGDHPQAKAVLASFCPRLPAQELIPLSLKILVDCSSSMAGDSITQARRALDEIGQWLNPTDRLAYFRFGSHCVPVIPALEPCTPLLVHRYARAIQGTEADLGGTKLHAALLEIFGPQPQATSAKADVLLITDGEVWDIEPTVKAARESGHRLFVVGVSSSPADSLLRELAEQSDGACELVTPNEDIAGAITRMVRRLRAGRDIGLRLDWGQSVLWQSPLPRQVFEGETLHVWARLDQPLQRVPVLHWSTAGAIGQDQAVLMQVDASGTTARLSGARHAETLPTGKEKLALALRHQLVTRQTSLFLVHQRVGGQKAEGLSALQQIQQMVSAGHQGCGRVLGILGPIAGILGMFKLPERLPMQANVESVSQSLFGDEMPPTVLSHKLLLMAFQREANTPEAAEHYLDQLQAQIRDPALQALLAELTRIAGSRAAAALLLDWLNRHLPTGPILSRQTERVLRAVLGPLNISICQQADHAIAQVLPSAKTTPVSYPTNQKLES